MGLRTRPTSEAIRKALSAIESLRYNTKAIKAVAGLRAALQELAGWQALETAPRDGTAIDLSDGARRVIDAWWVFMNWFAKDQVPLKRMVVSLEPIPHSQKLLASHMRYVISRRARVPLLLLLKRL